MPTIYDLFGYPMDDRSETAENTRKARQCPFMGSVCDGGGNRYQTKIRLTPQEPLTQYFNHNITEVVPGVCSIMAGNDIWVVCPRRLLAARYSDEGLPPVNYGLQEYERNLLVSAGLPRGMDIGIWSEVNLKQTLDDADINYHFDYIAAPLVKVSLEDELYNQNLTDIQIESELKGLVDAAKQSGHYAKGQRNPGSVPLLLPDLTRLYILEVMTASTSGSNTENATDMRSAFRNAILFNDHVSPGINKRQVWGRMVTQLFAKTALARQWGGHTAWIIQDELLRNIELTTRLRTDFISDNPHQNITLLVMHYETSSYGKRKISFKTTLEGDAGIDFDGNNTFTDILLPKATPSKVELLRAILRRRLGAIINL